MGKVVLGLPGKCRTDSESSIVDLQMEAGGSQLKTLTLSINLFSKIQNEVRSKQGKEKINTCLVQNFFQTSITTVSILRVVKLTVPSMEHTRTTADGAGTEAETYRTRRQRNPFREVTPTGNQRDVFKKKGNYRRSNLKGFRNVRSAPLQSRERKGPAKETQHKNRSRSTKFPSSGACQDGGPDAFGSILRSAAGIYRSRVVSDGQVPPPRANMELY